MNIIQDIILTGCSLVGAAALVPSVIGKDKPTLATSLPTTVMLFIMGGVYISLALWFSATTIFLSACLWLTLAIQKIIANSKQNKQDRRQ